MNVRPNPVTRQESDILLPEDKDVCTSADGANCFYAAGKKIHCKGDASYFAITVVHMQTHPRFLSNKSLHVFCSRQLFTLKI